MPGHSGRAVRKGTEVIETLPDAMLNHAIPEHMRSDNDPEMTSKRVKNWLRQIGVLNRPHLARHLSASQNGDQGGVYEQQTISRRIQD